MPADRVLERVLLAVLAGFGLLLLALFTLRFGYPYELEWMEGGMLAHTRRVLEGRPVFARPSLEFVAYMYPPLYYYVTAAVAAIAGEGFAALRAVSVVSALGCLALLYRIAARETGSPLAGAVAAGAFAASYQATGAWLDLARQDAFYLLWLLLAIERIRSGPEPVRALQAGLALAAACFVKQSVVLVALPVWLVLWGIDRRRAVAAGLGAGVPILLGVALLVAGSDGWYWYYTVTVPSGHPVEPGRGLAFWTRDIAGVVGISFVACGWHLLRTMQRDAGPESWLWPAVVVGALASSWSVRALVGAHLNNLLPVYAVLFLVGAMAFDAARRIGGRAGRLACLAVLVQLGLLAYDPRPLVPTRADRAAGDALVARIASIPGEVFVPNHGYLARLAGKGEYAHTLAIDNLLLDDPTSDARRDLELDFLAHFAERRFGAVVIDSDGRYREFAERFYGRGERLFEREDVFRPVSGGAIRPEWIYLKP
jgi:4-amino-4-deoxy-L-arabinose transferase-like glycosyltransferase